MTTVSEEPPKISAQDVKALRERTGAGMMDCKNALAEAGGDPAKAEELLKVKLGKKIQKLEGRAAEEGTIQSYIHPDGRTAVIVEVDCNTDFVASNEEFVAFARDLAVQIAGSPDVLGIGPEDVPEDVIASQTRVFEGEAATLPQERRAKAVEGKVNKWLGTVTLLDSKFHHPKFEGKTVKQVRDELAGKTGENIVIKRFARWEVGK
jgi:elongation factor Ts